MILCPYFPCLKMFFSFFTGVGVGDWVPFKERTLWNPRGFIPILNHGLSPFSSSREKPNIWRILSRASSLFFLLKLEILPQSLLFLVTKSVMNWNSSPPQQCTFFVMPKELTSSTGHSQASRSSWAQRMSKPLILPRVSHPDFSTLQTQKMFLSWFRARWIMCKAQLWWFKQSEEATSGPDKT